MRFDFSIEKTIVSRDPEDSVILQKSGVSINVRKYGKEIKLSRA